MKTNELTFKEVHEDLLHRLELLLEDLLTIHRKRTLTNKNNRQYMDLKEKINDIELRLFYHREAWNYAERQREEIETWMSVNGVSGEESEPLCESGEPHDWVQALGQEIDYVSGKTTKTHYCQDCGTWGMENDGKIYEVDFKCSGCGLFYSTDIHSYTCPYCGEKDIPF